MTASFYSINATVGLLIVTAVSILLACGGHVLVRRVFAKTEFGEHNEVAGFVFAIAGVIYAVLLAFVTVVVWERYVQAEERAREEVNATRDVWRLARHLPAPEARLIRGDVERYASSVSTDEWPKMRDGGESVGTQRAMVAMIDDVAAFDARGEQQGNVQNRLLDRVQVIADLRSHRINDTGSGVPPVLWVGLLIGSITIASFVYVFGMRNFRVQLLMTASTAMMIGLSFGVILELDYPFRGTVSVSPEAWIAFSDSIARERAGER